MSGTRATRANPYVGPRAFTSDETLYGRDREALELLDLLIAERIVLLYSPSGAGKTSLIQAALIPALKREGFHVRGVIRVNQEPPPDLGPAGDGLNRYVLSALQALEEAVSADRRTPPAELAGLELADYLGRWSPPADGPTNEVLVFDQFEEILTVDPLDGAARERFFAQVGAVLRDRGRWALFSMREDYVAALDPYLRSIPTRLSTTIRLDLLGDEAARRAIQEPARRAGVDFTDAAARHLLDDLRRVQVQRPDGTLEEQLGPYVEPVQLQVVCLRVWEKLPADASQIVEADVEVVGDVDSALADYYAERVEAIAAETGASERSIRAWFGDHLITGQGIRGQVLQEPEQSQGLENRIIWALVDTHLVRKESRGGRVWFELAHDRLIAPIRADNAAWFQAHLSTLQRQAELWEDKGRPAGLLLRDRVLVDAERWAATHDDRLTPTEREFLAACREAEATAERERRRNRLIRRLAIFASVTTLAAIVFLGVAAAFYFQATGQARIALSRQLAAQALNQLGQPDLALLLSLEAHRLDQNLEARGALLTALEHNPRLSAFLRGHAEDVAGVAFSPDGTLLASASADHTIILWDVATRRPVGSPLAGHAEGLWSVAFSPDGRWLASGGDDATIILWDVATGQRRGQPLTGHAGAVTRVAFSPDGTTLATGSRDNTVRLWDVAAGQPIGEPLRGHTDEVWGVAFSRDGRTLATGSRDTTVRLWDVATRRPLGTPVQGHAGWVRSVAFSPDGRTLASAGDDRTLILWDLATDPPLGSPLEGHTNSVVGLAFNSDGTRLATVSVDQTAILWDVATRRPLGTPLQGHAGWVWGVAFSPDGRTLATSSFDDSVILWDLGARQRLGQPLAGHTRRVSSVAIGPDGTTLATASDDRTIILWDLAGRRPLGPPLEGHLEGVRTLAFSPDGTTLASGSFDDTVILWDVAGHRPLTTLTGHRTDVNGVAFSPDGTALASAGCSRLNARGSCLQAAVHLWDVAGGRQLDQLTVDQTIGAWSVAFSPDGKLLAAGIGRGSRGGAGTGAGRRAEGGVPGSGGDIPGSGTGNDAIILWDARTRAPLGERLVRHHGPVRSLAFSPDSRTLASGSDDSSVLLWDLTTSPPSDRSLIGHAERVQGVAFSPDGALLASASGDNTIILWDVRARQRLGRPLAGHADTVQSVAFSPDGTILASGSSDATAILWDVSVASWWERACAIAGRNLTAEEWERFLGDTQYRPTCPNAPAGR